MISKDTISSTVHLSRHIAKLNETNCSMKNGLFSPDDNALNILKTKCDEKGIEAYVFKSFNNDNMNCGQLITES